MECISMVDVISHHLFPTVIHEFNLDIDTLDKKHMIEYIKRGQREKNMTQPEDAINRALMEFEYGNNGSTESQELLQLSSDGNKPSS